jgi:hypothetical protein
MRGLSLESRKRLEGVARREGFAGSLRSLCESTTAERLGTASTAWISEAVMARREGFVRKLRLLRESPTLRFEGESEGEEAQ